MPDARTRRFYLADLVMAVLICGLVVALFTASRGPGDAAWIFLATVVVTTMWASFRANRLAPTCEDCGRQFLPPDLEKPRMLGECPRCGRAQELRAASIRRWKGISQFLLAGCVAAVGVAAITEAGLDNRPTLHQRRLISGAGMLGGLSLLAWLAVGVYRRRLERPRARPCEWCGEVIPLEAAAGSSICPQCRLRHLQPEEARRVNRSNVLQGYLFLALLALLAAFMLWGGGWGGFFGPSPWIGVLAAAVVIFVGVVAALVIIVLAVNLRRRLQLRGERGTLNMARRATGREGDVIRDGPWTIWYSGPSDPAPALLQQLDSGIRRLEALTGGTPIAVPPARVLIFEEREGFLKFHRPIVGNLDLAGFDGFHFIPPFHLITLCTAPAPFRSVQPEELPAGWPSTRAWRRSGRRRPPGCRPAWGVPRPASGPTPSNGSIAR